jgi:hypothetical protein
MKEICGKKSKGVVTIMTHTHWDEDPLHFKGNGEELVSHFIRVI